MGGSCPSDRWVVLGFFRGLFTGLSYHRGRFGRFFRRGSWVAAIEDAAGMLIVVVAAVAEAVARATKPTSCSSNPALSPLS